MGIARYSDDDANPILHPLLVRTLLCKRRTLDGLLVTIPKYESRRQAATEQEKGCFLNKVIFLLYIQLDKTGKSPPDGGLLRCALAALA